MVDYEKRAQKCVLNINPRTEYPDDHPKYGRCYINALAKCLTKDHSLKQDSRCIELSQVISGYAARLLDTERDMEKRWRKYKGWE